MDTAERDAKVSRLLILEGLANSAVLGLKLTVGMATGSLAILADALHSLADVVNNIIAWVVVRASRKPPDQKHPYGHQKYEMLAVFVLAVLLAVVGLEVAARALTAEAEPPAATPWALALMLVVLAVNLIIAFWQRYWSRRLNSAILKADASHTLADALTTVVVIVGWQLSVNGYPWLDAACALAVATLIFYLSFGLFRDVLPALVDEAAIEPELLQAAIEGIPGVRRAPRIRSRWKGTERAVDVVVTVRSSLTTAESHEIANAIEAMLSRDFNVADSSIHIEPDDR